jgi:hypothetical protein
LRAADGRVYVDVGGGAHGYLAGDLIEDYGDQLVRQVSVGGLKDIVRAIEDDEGVAGDVCLGLLAAGWSAPLTHDDLLPVPASSGDSLELRLRSAREEIAMHEPGGDGGAAAAGRLWVAELRWAAVSSVRRVRRTRRVNGLLVS